MILFLVGLAFAVPILWTFSGGALREARRARQLDPRDGCQAWVRVRGLPGRLYRCGAPVYAGGRWCLRHERAGPRDAEDVDAEAVRIDEPQAVGRALAHARIGIPVALVTVLGAAALLAWFLARVG